MVRVAEASGSLETVLDRIAQGREKAQKLQGKALSQILYPCILIVVAIAAVTIMLLFVVPRFKQMIVQAGRPCPSRPASSSALSDWLIANGQSVADRDRPRGAGVLLFAWQAGTGPAKDRDHFSSICR